jgi:ribosomal protein S18 acetylase RimI-like enzyme
VEDKLMEFRKANINDVKELINLRKRQLLDEGGNEEQNIDLELKEYFSKNIVNDTFISWVAIENNEIIATSGLCFYQLPPNFTNPSGKVAYITNMYTKNKFRRKGIASKLLEKVINEAQLLNYRIIRLHASLDGKNLYLKYGFNYSDGYMHLKI